MKKYINNFFHLISAEYLSKGIGFLTTIILARTLGAELFGQVGFALVIYSYAALIAQQGLDVIGTKEIARNPNRISEIVRSIFSIRIYLSLFAFIFIIIFAIYLIKSVELRYLVILQGFSLILIPITMHYVFQGMNQMQWVGISRIIQALSYFGLVILFVNGIYDVKWVPVSFFISTGLSCFPLIILYYLRGGKLKFVYQVKDQMVFLRQSFPIALAHLMIQVYYNIDTIFLQYLKGSSEVGYYAAAYRIILFVTVIPSIIMKVFFQNLSQMYLKQKETNDLNLYITIMIVTGIPIGVLGILLAPSIITFLYGNSYLDAILPLQILFCNVIFVFINMALANPLLAWDKQKDYLKIVSSGAITNIICNVILIPKYGMKGAAIATVLSEIMVFFNAKRVFKNNISINLIMLFRLPIIAIALSIGIAYLTYIMTQLDIVWIASIFIIIYSSFIAFQKNKLFHTFS